MLAKILRGELPCFKIYEDEHSLAFMDIMPQAAGHALVIPKFAAETLAELPLQFAAPLLTTVQKVMAVQKQVLAVQGVVLMQLNGAEAGQTVPHLHFHLIPAHLSKLKAHGAEQGDMAQIKALAERLAGEAFARQIGKIMLTDPNRSSQIPYMDLSVGQQHSDLLIAQVQKQLIKSLAQPFALEQLAAQFHLTKRTLLRRFKTALNDTPLNYLQRLRVEQAKRLLETTNQPVEQIVLQVGYEDVSSFRKLFLQYTELTPSQYRQKFSQGDTFHCCPTDSAALS